MLLTLLVSCAMVADHYGTPADPADDTEHFFTVPQGATAHSLGPLLQDEGIVDSGDDFVMYVRLTKAGGCIKAGRFRLRRNMSAADIIDTLCGSPLPEDVPFTVVEGWRIKEIDAALVAKGWTQPGEYTALALDPARFTAPFPLPADSLEGYLYPETYMVVPEKWDTAAFVQRQLDLLAERFWKPYEDEIKESPRSFADVVIMASLLEREEPRPGQRPLVAGILWKRLGSGWNLGVDATSRYTLDQWNDRQAFLVKLRDPDDPYNTRLRQGLPPTAIGNPAIDSLSAALAPETSDYWYYLHDKSQVIHPSRSAAEHEAFRRQYDIY